MGPWYLIPDADAAFILMCGFLGGFSSSWHFPHYCSSLGKQQASSPVVGFPVTCLLELSALDLELQVLEHHFNYHISGSSLLKID